ncbi:NACHT domain-containing protein [Streptomyces sp. NPDC014991]|uniref:NACHT domain-containing protein n=1 Tax=Streptomyces sp. NPDC014991 TaxID=3364935 RepID=UPI003701EED5
MEPAVLGGKLASSLIGPLVKRLFVPDGPGAGLVDRPVRLSALVSFRGVRRTLGEKEVRGLAGRLTAEAMASPGERPFPADEETAVTDTLTRRLLALGDLDMDDVQAVRLGSHELARHLHRHAPPPDGLSADASAFLDSATQWACLHILEFFTRRSTFVARTLVEQTRTQRELIAKVDELIARTPRPDAQDLAFERRYLPYVADRHHHITIYGIDLRDSPDRWPLEVAYLSLEATAAEDTVRDGTGRPPLTTGRLPAEDALAGGSRVLLRGDAGSGKTTLVQWLAVTAARDADRIPYVLPLRTLIRTGPLPAPAGFLGAVNCPLTPPEGWTDRVLTAGRGLVLLDGLDEIPAADRHRTRDWLRSLLAAYPGNAWLLTSRPTAVRSDWLAPEGFQELTLAPMRRPEVATFVHRWHEAARAPEYEGPLLDSLRTKRDLARLATNPLMCGLICALHRERRGYLPTGRKELYDAALTMLLARRDRERGMGAVDGVELGEEVQLELLQRLAYALVLSGRTEMDLGTAEGIVERSLPSVASAAGQGDAPTVLRAVLLRSGLLRQPSDGVVDFVHRTFQDYLGARYAVEEGHLDVLAGHADDTQWEDVIRMAVAHARPRERATLLRRLLSRDTPRLTLLALACLEHAAALEPGVRAEVEARAEALIPPGTTEEARVLAEAGPLVLELLPGPAGLTTEQARGVAVTASLLGDEEPDTALAVLRRFRDHPDLGVRRQLVGTWGRFDAGEYATEVLDRLERTDLVLTCESVDQRDCLARMRPWHRLQLTGPHLVEDIVAALPATGQVTTLGLMANGLLTDCAALLAFGSLSDLHLAGCPAATGLHHLADLPLTNLVLSRVGDVTGLGSLRSLTRLSVSGVRLPGTDLTHSLPVDAPLESLYLGGGSFAGTGLRGLEKWTSVRTLSLELSGADDFDPVPELPHVRTLVLYGIDDSVGLATAAARFPRVRSVVLITRPGPRASPTRYAGFFPQAEVLVG